MQPCAICEKYPTTQHGVRWYCSTHHPEETFKPIEVSALMPAVVNTPGTLCSCGSGLKVSVTFGGKNICAECARKAVRW